MDWNAIQRFDKYIADANVKATIIITYNISTLTLVAATYSKPPSTGMTIFHGIMLSLAALGSFWAVIFCLLVMKPHYNSSPKEDDLSVFFFKEIVQNGEVDKYLACIESRSPDDITEDIRRNAYSLAVIVNNKFKLIDFAYCGLVVQIFFITLYVSSVVVMKLGVLDL